jgi:hypothetical protein
LLIKYIIIVFKILFIYIRLKIRKIQTEPPNKNKSSLVSPLTPNSTPPWKSVSVLNQNDNESPMKEFRPTRQKLVFDDNDDNDEVSPNIEESNNAESN